MRTHTFPSILLGALLSTMLAAACSSSDDATGTSPEDDLDGGKTSDTAAHDGASDGEPTASGPFSVGGTVRGLRGTGLVLHDNGGDSLAVERQTDADAGDGQVRFTFATALANGSSYGVTVATQPTTPRQTCTVSSGEGTIDGADVANVAVSCATDTFSVGGSVTGLDPGESVVLQNSGGPEFAVSSATFVAPNKVEDGRPFEISVKASPSGKKCTATDGSGTLSGADVTNVAVTCTKACGDGVVDPGEECDDGNTVDADTCANACRRNPIHLGQNHYASIDGALKALGEPFQVGPGGTGWWGDAPTAGVLISSANGGGSRAPDGYQTFLDAGGHILLIGGGEATAVRDFVGTFLNVGSSYAWHTSFRCTNDWNAVTAHPMTRYLPATYEFSDEVVSSHMIHLLPTQPEGAIALGRTCEEGENHILATRTYPSGGTFTYFGFAVGETDAQTATEFVQPFFKGYLEYVRSKR